MRRTLVSLAIVFASASGCSNACQSICGRMADYAEECGFTVPEAELDACRESWSSDVEKTDRMTCRDFGSPDQIATQWSCDELEQYFAAGG